MKRSEVIEELLQAYFNQEGKRAKWEITNKAMKLISNLKKEES